MSLREALKLMRLELGMTQTDLAKRLGKAFVSVNRWENGKGFPSRENAKSILEIARKGRVSKDCYKYLNEMLMPNLKREKSAAAYGFPDVDREFLFQLADCSANSVYVVEADTFNLLYANRKAERFAVHYLCGKNVPVAKRRLTDQSDRRCFHYFGNLDKPCSFCPLASIADDSSADVVNVLPRNGRTVHTHVRATRMGERRVYAIYLTDITEITDERNALYELTNDIPDGVGIYNVYYDERVELAFMNEFLYKLIGSERKDELLKNGETDLLLLHPDDRELLRAEVRHSIAGKRNASLKIRMRTPDGSYSPIDFKAKLIKKDTEKLTFYCLFRTAEQI